MNLQYIINNRKFRPFSKHLFIDGQLATVRDCLCSLDLSIVDDFVVKYSLQNGHDGECLANEFSKMIVKNPE